MKKDKLTMYRSIFADVLEEYQDLKSRHGLSGAMDYEQAANSGGGGTRCSKIVRPSISDFICDVELAARRALTPLEYQFFRQYYGVELGRPPIRTSAEEQKIDSQMYAAALPTPPNNDFNSRVMEKVGEMFLKRRLHPTAVYFAPRCVA